MYQEGEVDEDPEAFMEGDDFGDEYEEEYVQYSDSSISASGNAADNQVHQFLFVSNLLPGYHFC